MAVLPTKTSSRKHLNIFVCCFSIIFFSLLSIHSSLVWAWDETQEKAFNDMIATEKAFESAHSGGNIVDCTGGACAVYSGATGQLQGSFQFTGGQGTLYTPTKEVLLQGPTNAFVGQTTLSGQSFAGTWCTFCSGSTSHLGQPSNLKTYAPQMTINTSSSQYSMSFPAGSQVTGSFLGNIFSLGTGQSTSVSIGGITITGTNISGTGTYGLWGGQAAQMSLGFSLAFSGTSLGPENELDVTTYMACGSLCGSGLPTCPSGLTCANSGFCLPSSCAANPNNCNCTNLPNAPAPTCSNITVADPSGVGAWDRNFWGGWRYELAALVSGGQGPLVHAWTDSCNGVPSGGNWNATDNHGTFLSSNQLQTAYIAPPAQTPLRQPGSQCLITYTLTDSQGRSCSMSTTGQWDKPSGNQPPTPTPTIKIGSIQGYVYLHNFARPNFAFNSVPILLGGDDEKCYSGQVTISAKDEITGQIYTGIYDGTGSNGDCSRVQPYKILNIPTGNRPYTLTFTNSQLIQTGYDLYSFDLGAPPGSNTFPTGDSVPVIVP